MAGLITWYDILGILSGASTEQVRYACEARVGQVSPQMISGAPSKVIKAADRARAAADEAWRVLGDPSSRERYEVDWPVQYADRAGLAPTPEVNLHGAGIRGASI
jgi:curved DNA-binding protein CbpA